MVNFALFFILASSLSVLASPTAESTVGELERNLNKLNNELMTLKGHVEAFPPHSGGTLEEALRIHQDGVQVAIALSDCSDSIVDVTSVSEGVALHVLYLVDNIVPIIEDVLKGIVDRKAAFQHLVLGGAAKLVKRDLRDLYGAAVILGTRLIYICPSDFKPRAIKIKGTIDVAFGEATAAYANV